MSELTPCNYCTLKHLERDGPVLVVPDKDGLRVERDGKFLAWFAALTDYCAC